MKKYFEVVPDFDELKSKMVMVKEEENNKKTVYIVLAVLATLLAATAIGVVVALKCKMKQNLEEEWDYDWNDYEDDLYDVEDCSCNDEDVDNSVKIEEI